MPAVLKAGSYAVAGGRTQTLRLSDLHMLARRGRELLAAGQHVPIVREPPSGLSLAEQKAAVVRGCLGHVGGWELAGDRLHLVPDVPEAADRSELERSPLRLQLTRDFTDGSGRTWPGLSITALTLPSRSNSGGMVSMSLQPVRAVRGLWTVQLSLDNTETRMDLVPPSKLSDLIEALSLCGIELPPDARLTAETAPAFVDQLIEACQAAQDNNRRPEDELEDVPEAEPESGPVMMSLHGMSKKASTKATVDAFFDMLPSSKQRRRKK